MVIEKQPLAQCLPLSLQMRHHKGVIHRRHALVKAQAEEIPVASHLEPAYRGRGKLQCNWCE